MLRVLFLLALVGCGRLAFDPVLGDDGGSTDALGISSPPADAEVGPTVSLTGNCTTGSQIDLAGAGLLSPSSTTCDGGQFDVTIAFTAGFGAKAITIAQGTTSVARSFVRIPQQVTQISATSGSTISQGFTVNCALAIQRPPNIADGDLLIGMIYSDGGSPASISTPGFQRLALDGPTFVAFGKIAANEPAVYQFNIVAGMGGADTCASGGAIAAFRNADPANPIDAQSQIVNGNATALIAPEVTATNPTILVAFFGSNGPGSGIAKPASMTIDGDAPPNGSFGISVGGFGNALVAWEEIDAGATGARTATVATPVPMAGGMLAVRPN